MTPRSRKWLARLASLLPILLLGALTVLSVSRYSVEGAMTTVPYSELVAAVTAGQVKEAEIEADQVRATLRATGSKPETRIVAERLPNVDDQRLLQALEAAGVVVRGKTPRSNLSVLWWALIPVGLFFLLWSGGRAGAAGRGGPLGVGRSRARIVDRAAENATTFADVAGVDEAKAELVEVVKFLKEPTAYAKVGAHVPKGVLLVGAPGTGKTLLAKAVAGEAGVPFFSISGSEFVEMFVGVGASRVRDLFDQAKERAPCIIFIDELDAVGKARSGVQGFVANEEREQTLNQLLVEMDGFDSGRGLVVLAATNRPEILDRALLRAGRFDRQVVVDGPDVKGRQAILRVHVRKVALGVDVDLEAVAQRTPGMVGSDLANVVNEAALAAVRRGSVKVDAVDFEEAVDRIQLGLRKEGRIMSDDEKRRVAFHEAGHALVALSMKHADPVHRVTIIPRSVGALGATLQLPAEDRYLMTREELLDKICVLLGGRASEEIACADVSTGAADDLERATELARQMICRFGMSDGIGVVTVGGRKLGGWHEPSPLPGASEASLRLVDRETARIVDAARERARAHLVARRPALDALAAELLTKETLQRADLERIVRDAEAPGSPARRPANLLRLHAG